eukprot:COSAG01_NODE_15040_length_1381_cov_1.180967_1_plen_308_part_00
MLAYLPDRPTGWLHGGYPRPTAPLAAGCGRILTHCSPKLRYTLTHTYACTSHSGRHLGVLSLSGRSIDVLALLAVPTDGAEQRPPDGGASLGPVSLARLLGAGGGDQRHRPASCAVATAVRRRGTPRDPSILCAVGWLAARVRVPSRVHERAPPPCCRLPGVTAAAATGSRRMRGCVSWRHSSPTAAHRARGCECNGRPAQLTNTPCSRRCGQALRHGRGGGGSAFAHDLLRGAAGHHGGHGRNGHAAAHGARAGTQGAVSRVRGVAGAHARAIHGAAHCTAPISSPTSPTSPDLCSSTTPRSVARG